MEDKQVASCSLGVGRTVAIVGGLLVVVGAFLPWGTVLGMSVNGTEGDGFITIALAVIAGILIAIKKVPLWVPMIFAILTLVVGGYDFYNMYSVNDQFTGADYALAEEFLGDMSVSVGTGLYMTVVGGIVLVVGNILAFMKK